jgi:hypothetical protein
VEDKVRENRNIGHKLRREDGALPKSIEVENRKAALFRATRECLDQEEVYALFLERTFFYSFRV